MIVCPPPVGDPMPATVLAFVAEVKDGCRQRLDETLAALDTRVREGKFSPFRNIAALHFASLVVFDTPGFRPTLVFENNFDGALNPYINALLDAAMADVHSVFACCIGYDPAADDQRAHVASFLRAHAVRPGTYHVGNFARTKAQIVGERELRGTVDRGIDCYQQDGERVVDRERAFDLVRNVVRSNGAFDWAVRPSDKATLDRFIAGMRLLGLFVAPVLFVVAIWFVLGHSVLSAVAAIAIVAVLVGLFALALWWHERRDVPMDLRSFDRSHDERLAAGEDRQAQNHLASITVVKDGRFRRMTLRLVLWVTNRFARVATKGRLSGIPSIHFAHWSLLPDGKRLLFLSNYDGAWSAYLDDFVDLAARGLTAIWSNTVGFPKTRFLLFKGARDRTAFKAFAR